MAKLTDYETINLTQALREMKQVNDWMADHFYDEEGNPDMALLEKAEKATNLFLNRLRKRVTKNGRLPAGGKDRWDAIIHVIDCIGYEEGSEEIIYEWFGKMIETGKLIKEPFSWRPWDEGYHSCARTW